MSNPNKPSFESTLKSLDTEEWFDLYFYRPIGYQWALLFQQLKITPNQVTFMAIIIGIAAGICFYFANVWVNLLGIFLLVWANSYDSADGQLARMTNQKSNLGRILDGACGDFWFGSIYIAIVVRLWPEWNFWILILALLTGYFHTKQAAMSDYYRNLHLLFLNGKKGSEIDNTKVLLQKQASISWRKQPVIKFFEIMYFFYTQGQELWTPKMQKMLSLINTKYQNIPPDWFRKAFREKSLPLMKYTNLLSFNLRSFVLFISVLCTYPWIYFVFEMTIMNLLLIYMLKRHESICAQFIVKLEADQYNYDKR
ncbi:MAG: CDP-alcohol phosphatidyltransferase family protein [Dysgonamonadaceae bacterium]|jgi:phosphatidylserine synthase|nr:CDP-alcohol phosphatidyltransferase family protein [Dysgonamonadaceae bacterium]